MGIESPKEMISRVTLMSEGCETWDLSPRDVKALAYVVRTRQELKVALAALYSRVESHVSSEDDIPYSLRKVAIDILIQLAPENS